MGKRSSFERIPRDFYPTPFEAVPPLIPYLRGVKSFSEPCVGAGDLVRHLESFGLHCAHAGDVATGQDALALNHCGGADCVITNPPFDTEHRRKLMHALIMHFMRIAPAVWLLIDLDWSATKQAAPFLPYCSDIVVIGRIKWIEGSKHTGKDNYAWFRFAADHADGPIFHPKGSAPESRLRLCAHCRKSYEPQRTNSRFCTATCRQRAHRKALSVTSSVTPASSTAIEHAGEVFRYVRHDDVARFEADGWERLPSLDQTHHGYWSALMRRRERD